jgi:alkylated DNA nucleotide flippase Atl1
MTARGLTIEFRVPQRRDNRRKRPDAPEPVPRIARLLALAHKWEGMVRRGEVKSYAEVAALTGLTRSRVTQVCKLRLLSPKLQEQILTCTNFIPERRIRRASNAPLWQAQERLAACGT